MKKKKDIILTQGIWKAVSFHLKAEHFKQLKNKGVRLHIRKLVDEARVIFDKIIWEYKEVKKFDYPSTWWDAFKLRFFPKWLIKLFPAKMTVIKIKEVARKLPKSFNGGLTEVKEEKYFPMIRFEEPDEYDIKWDKYEE